MPPEKILLLLSDPDTGAHLERNSLGPAGYDVILASDLQAAAAVLEGGLPELILMNERVRGGDTLELAARLLESAPHLPILLLPIQHSESLAVTAARMGLADYLQPPVRPFEVLQAVQRALERRRRLEEWASQKARKNTDSLKERLTGLETLQRIGREVTSLLDLDRILAAVVDAAVELTQAEEGSLLLLDEGTGELYMRAARNFQEDFVRTFRLPTRDTLAGQVLSTGQPVLIDTQTPQKIKTSYLVHNLIYVPLVVHGRVIGVLEVDNRKSGHPFAAHHIDLVSALAGYAAIAIENARLYSRTEVERSKLETILTRIEEGVIVIDQDERLILVNPTARNTFGLNGKELEGRPIQEVIQNQELLELLSEDKRDLPRRAEISIEDGRVLNAQFTPIPEVGLVVTMQDITHLKELDHIKSDFVNTVSHDLRSPLTAILGYVELVERVGPVNDQQREFIHRVQLSVQSITALINDLLDLGRIEAGFDSRKEPVSIAATAHFVVEGLKGQAAAKEQELTLDVPEALPPVLGSPIRLRQLLNNLFSNALKYTQREGRIAVSARAEDRLMILRVVDNGPGIPLADQPYIFDKFYRARNVTGDTAGTGLGLAIVKSIVDNHQGRIWVDSSPGKGTTFTVVLPLAEDA